MWRLAHLQFYNTFYACRFSHTNRICTVYIRVWYKCGIFLCVSFMREPRAHYRRVQPEPQFQWPIQTKCTTRVKQLFFCVGQSDRVNEKRELQECMYMCTHCHKGAFAALPTFYTKNRDCPSGRYSVPRVRLSTSQLLVGSLVLASSQCKLPVVTNHTLFFEL